MRIALAQMNSSLGQFAQNREKILDFVRRAAERHCDLVVFPEATLFGYHPNDLLERASVVQAQLKELKKLHGQLPKGLGVLVGAFTINPDKKGKAYLNAAVFLERGKKAQVFAKELLPNYDVFDESRHIQPGHVKDNILKFKGHKILVTICEDIWAWPSTQRAAYTRWKSNPLKSVAKSKVDLVVNLSASPFTRTKLKLREQVTKSTAQHFGCPMVYVNMVGSQDEMIYDGGSMALDKAGRVTARCVRFDEDLNVVEIEKKTIRGGALHADISRAEALRQALVLGIRDFVKKTGMARVHLGLSGGIDSAVVAALAVDALGTDNVNLIYLHGPYSSTLSRKLAQQLSDNLCVKLHDLSIEAEYKVATQQIDKELGPMPFGLVHENIQSRLRGMKLMAFSNLHASMLLGTTNKSEMTVGYGTLYGDLIGGLMPIGDLLKGEVFELAKEYNREAELIPNEIITRPPSAELRENQKDSDSLPEYKILDPLVEKLVVQGRSAKGAAEERVLKMLTKSEFKRWQSPPVLKISAHAFGRGRRLPIAHSALY